MLNQYIHVENVSISLLQIYDKVYHTISFYILIVVIISGAPVWMFITDEFTIKANIMQYSGCNYYWNNGNKVDILFITDSSESTFHSPKSIFYDYSAPT